MSLSKDDLNDIKQLLEVTIDSALEAQTEELRGEIRSLTVRMERVERRLGGVEDRLESFEVVQNETLNAIGGEFIELKETGDDHEARITTLEAAPAR